MTAFKVVLTAVAMVMVLLAAPLAIADEPDSIALMETSREQLAQDISQQYQKAERSQHLQTDLPLEIKTAEAKKVSERKPFIMPAAVAKLLLIIAVGTIVIVLVLALRKNLWGDDQSKKLGHKGQNEDDAASMPNEAAALRMDKAGLTADDLAAQGQYTEAMHLLLLQSVNELRRRLSVSIADSLTSREILQRIGLSPEGKNFFGDIIGHVEISYFGLHEPGAEEYAACRTSYHTLTDILRRGKTA